jgi:23S rRNA U2552 (ribose-2'-O)-methylase RlmE/FtsJ
MAANNSQYRFNRLFLILQFFHLSLQLLNFSIDLLLLLLHLLLYFFYTGLANDLLYRCQSVFDIIPYSID